jgi:hypothetical protein
LQSIFEDATKKTKDLKEDREKYAKVLEDLILEVSLPIDRQAAGSKLIVTCATYSRCSSC